MSKTYYDSGDLRNFGKITEWSEELGTKFFDYYGKVFEEGALTAREKSLIALAVAHTEQCPYCIDAYTKDTLQRGVTKEQMNLFLVADIDGNKKVFTILCKTRLAPHG